ncbi:MAG: sulfotransferase [Deltaproteobacteria bacterium]|nr:sulfotransferase [Deltaproteobacteria bacterium]
MIRKVAFDVDCMVSRFREISPTSSPPVFIACLARAGSTILLEALYSTNLFTTLTYRDMPFVTAPLLWGLITAQHRSVSDLKERAHGDRLHVNFDSPEAFEEVFWMTFTADVYVKEDCLECHDIDVEVIEKYGKFIDNVVKKAGDKASLRYLAKNNNNILRIDSIKSAFPEAVILVPFRNPLDHAKSLYLQHKRFRRMHMEDAFSLKYMNWLGHFEFGENFKPFKVSDEALPAYSEEPEEEGYWLRYWKCVYEYIIERRASKVIFFDYDTFCVEPDRSLDKLGEALSVDAALLKPFCARVKSVTRHEHFQADRALSLQVANVYHTLKALSLQSM